jgi:hypothetical protein
MNYDELAARRQNRNSRRDVVDRSSHELREALRDASMMGDSTHEVPLDEMLENGEIHSNIYGERVEGYPGQGDVEYDAYDADDHSYRSGNAYPPLKSV